jgi:hypothetical protein
MQLHIGQQLSALVLTSSVEAAAALSSRQIHWPVPTQMD